MAAQAPPESTDTAADGGPLKVLDPTVLRIGTEPEGGINSYSVSKDGQLLLTSSCSETGDIRLWNLCTREHLLDFVGHEAPVLSVAFSPDATKLKFVSGSEDGTAMIWDVGTGVVVYTLHAHSELEGGVKFVAWSPDGATIATGSDDRAVCLWNPDGTKRSSLQHDDDYLMVPPNFSPDGKFLLTASNTTAFLWDCTSSTLLSTFDGHTEHIWSMRFSGSGDRIVTASGDRTVRVWDAHNGTEIVTLRQHTSPVCAAEFSPDGRHVATGSHDERIVVCASDSGEMKFDIRRAPLAQIYALAYSHSGKYLASGDAGGLVRLWDGKSGAFVAEFQGHDEKVSSLTWTQDDNLLVSYSGDGMVRVWSILDVLTDSTANSDPEDDSVPA